MKSCLIAFLLLLAPMVVASDLSQSLRHPPRHRRSLTQPRTSSNAANAAASALSRSAQYNGDDSSTMNKGLLNSVLQKLSLAVSSERYGQAKASASYLIDLLDELISSDPRGPPVPQRSSRVNSGDRSSGSSSIDRGSNTAISRMSEAQKKQATQILASQRLTESLEKLKKELTQAISENHFNKALELKLDVDKLKKSLLDVEAGNMEGLDKKWTKADDEELSRISDKVAEGPSLDEQFQQALVERDFAKAQELQKLIQGSKT